MIPPLSLINVSRYKRWDTEKRENKIYKYPPYVIVQYYKGGLRDIKRTLNNEMKYVTLFKNSLNTKYSKITHGSSKKPIWNDSLLRI